MNSLHVSLKDIIRILSLSKNIEFNNDLISLKDNKIITPIGDITQILLTHISKLSDQPVDLNLLQNLVMALEKNNSIVRLNHIGFGYKVRSQQEERKRLVRLVKATKDFLYEEESNDFGLWLFFGNKKNWEKPLVEFVPVEKTDPMEDYVLPHIQIDIDTNLCADEIENMLKIVYSNKVQSYRIAVINGITHIVRNRIGIMNGVNIFIDLATNSRNVKLHRQKCLIKIS